MAAATTAPAASWLAREREAAAKDLAASAPPPAHSEIWRRTPYSQFGFDGASEAPATSAAGPLELDGLSGRLLQRDGGAPVFALAAGLAEKGVVLCGLDEAAARYPELVRPQLEGSWGDAEERRPESLNRAYWRGGAFLYVPDGLRLDAPFRLRFERAQAPVACPRLLVVAGRNAEFAFQEEHGSGPGAHSVLAYSKTRLGAGARVSAGFQQEAGPEARFFWSGLCELAENAQLTHASFSLGGKVHKTHLRVDLAGAGARSELFGVTLGAEGQRFDSYTRQWHKAPRTSSDLIYRSALRGGSKAVYNGLIRIEKEALGTEAFQENHNLLLSDRARADSTPILEILTDEVRCKHGATAGPLNKEDLFYLATRGFSPEEATRTLVMGFFEPVLRRLPVEAERARLAGEVEGRL